MCLDLEDICAAATHIKLKDKLNHLINVILITLNDSKRKEDIQQSFKKVINPSYGKHLIHKYIEIFKYNKLSSKDKKKTIFGYLSVQKLYNLHMNCSNLLFFIANNKNTKDFFPKEFLLKLPIISDVSIKFYKKPNKKNYNLLLKHATQCMQIFKIMKQDLSEKLKIVKKKEVNQKVFQVEESLEDLVFFFINDNCTLEQFVNFKTLLSDLCQLHYDLVEISEWDHSILDLNELIVETPMCDVMAHAESKLIYYISNELISDSKHSLYTDERHFLIGCSKLSCYICESFIFYCEKKYKIICEMRGFHRKPYLGWNYPFMHVKKPFKYKEELDGLRYCILLVKEWFLKGKLSFSQDGRDTASRATSLKSTYSIFDPLNDHDHLHLIVDKMLSDHLTNVLIRVQDEVMQELDLQRNDILILVSKSKIKNMSGTSCLISGSLASEITRAQLHLKLSLQILDRIAALDDVPDSDLLQRVASLENQDL